MSGWIKIHRKILKNPVVCKDADHFALWMYILCSAAYEEHSTLFAGKKIVLKPGQFVTGADKVSKELDISESKVRRILKFFESDGQIEQQTNNCGRLITVVNWDSYQNTDGQSDGRVADEWRTSDGRVTPTKEIKNIRKKEESTTTYDSVIEEWNSLPEPISKVTKIAKGTTREKKLRKRIADYGEGEVLKAIENIKRSNFLQGGGNKGWIVTFDWFISPENFIKVLEGNYNDKDQPKEEDDAWDRMWRLLDEDKGGGERRDTASGW